MPNPNFPPRIPNTRVFISLLQQVVYSVSLNGTVSRNMNCFDLETACTEGCVVVVVFLMVFAADIGDASCCLELALPKEIGGNYGRHGGV